MSAKRNQPPPGNQRRTLGLMVGGVVAVIALALVLAVSLGGSSKKRPPPPPNSAVDARAVIAAATAVPLSVSDQIGAGDSQSPPKAISGAPLTAGGKPQVLYIGAEYCPFCAAERWAMVIALSRFGTFSGLSLTHSSSTDIYPNTPTFTFHNSTYSSPYLVFAPVETTTNQPDGNGGYLPLDTPSADQSAILRSLDPSGGIPFVDIGGRYLINGATYDPAVLQGKTAPAAATALADPSTPVARAAVGASNAIVAAVCKITNQQPANVCATPKIQAIQTSLG
jgi:hypothetical protein